MRFLLKFCFAFLPLWLATQPAVADGTVQRDITRATLMTDTLFIKAGTPFKLGILLEPQYGWHSYWENPGDAGLATDLTWTLPEGFTAGPTEWPVPERIDEGPLTIYGYHNTVLLPITVTPPQSLSDASEYHFKLKASWLICKEICIPESADLDIALIVGEPSPSMNESRFLDAVKNAPKKIADVLPYYPDTKHIRLAIPMSVIGIQSVNHAEFFMREINVQKYTAMPTLTLNKETADITVETVNPAPEHFSGLLVLKDDSSVTHAFDIRFEKAPIALATTPAGIPQPQGGNVFLPAILLSALLGGLILNLMPCVLPVLSLKALTLVKKSGSEKSVARAHGIAYTLGVLLSFGILAGFLIALQQGGEAVGWGYQMQSPVFVGVLIYLLFLVGLNLSGLFDLPVLLGNTGHSLTSDAGPRGSFFTGVLATAVATPCTAPFMASAVGVALTLPAWQSMLVFEALGLGLALPFLLISMFPVLLRFLPKPGAWMETFKQCLAFPMYVSVIWLLWVLTLQVGAEGVILALVGMLVLLFAIWMRRMFTSGLHYRIAAVILVVFSLGLTLHMLNEADMRSPMENLPADYSDIATASYSDEALTALRKEGKAVFVDATAAWCITCQVNARTAIHTDTVMNAFKDNGITLMIADWTRRNSEIGAFLNSFGYQGVPLYVYYPAEGGQPIVLPQILTPEIILNTIKPKGE